MEQNIKNNGRTEHRISKMGLKVSVNHTYEFTADDGKLIAVVPGITISTSKDARVKLDPLQFEYLVKLAKTDKEFREVLLPIVEAAHKATERYDL